MRVLYWIVLGLAALALALFAASNRTPVALGFWPLGLTLELPLYLAILLTFLVGFLCGALVAWVGGRHWRREARHARRRVIALEHELEATQAHLAESLPATTTPSPGPELASPRAPAARPASAAARG